jgi:hypothetical protein
MTQRQQLERLTDAELEARLGPGLFAYLDGRSLDELERLGGGDTAVAEAIWAGFQQWQEEQE